MHPNQRAESSPPGNVFGRGMYWLKRCLPRILCLLVAPISSLAAHAQDISLNPTRPTVANAATIQSLGVLQIESGYDAYPQHVPGNQGTVDTLISYVPLPRLRLDFDWSAFNYQTANGESTQGIGTIAIGGKIHLRKEQFHHAFPAIGVQYEAELPTASREAFQGYGQQAILLINHHYGKDGDVDVMANGSIVQSDCETSTGCRYGGQQAIAFSYHLQKQTRLYAEVFAQNTAQSNTPPGTYVFGGFYRQFTDSFGLDGGLRFGVSDHSASFGTTVGIVFGRQLHKDKPSH